MAAGGTIFSVGRDVQAVLIAPNGTRIDLTNLTDFDIKPQYKMAVSDALNRPPAHRALPSGHTGTFNIDRRDGTNDLLFVLIEQAWWAFGSADNGTGSTGSLLVQITEIGGGVTTQQYLGVSLWLENAGSIKQDSPIKQTIGMFASQRVS
jgi:hypothetical protein